MGAISSWSVALGRVVSEGFLKKWCLNRDLHDKEPPSCTFKGNISSKRTS